MGWFDYTSDSTQYTMACVLVKKSMKGPFLVKNLIGLVNIYTAVVNNNLVRVVDECLPD